MKTTYTEFAAQFLLEFPDAELAEDAHSGALECNVNGKSLHVSDPETHVALAGVDTSDWLVGSGTEQHTASSLDEAVEVAADLYARLLLGVVSL
jgi:hypothetical protein